MSGYPDLMRALEIIEQLSTGWKHGTEGEHLLRINDEARRVVCGHAPVILHRSGGASAGERNSCGKCGRFIRTVVAAGTHIVVWVIDFEREAA
jgi:hypothetical protein